MSGSRPEEYRAPHGGERVAFFFARDGRLVGVDVRRVYPRGDVLGTVRGSPEVVRVRPEILVATECEAVEVERRVRLASDRRVVAERASRTLFHREVADIVREIAGLPQLSSVAGGQDARTSLPPSRVDRITTSTTRRRGRSVPREGDVKVTKGQRFVRRQARSSGCYLVKSGRPVYEWVSEKAETSE